MRLPRDVPHLVLYAMTVAVIAALVVAASTSTAAFGTYNPDWDGTADLRTEADDRTDLTIVQEPARYDSLDANGTIAFVLAPNERYNDTEAARLARFAENGGTLVVAGDVGPHGNALLADLGTEARFAGALLRDEEHHYRTPAMPVADETRSHRYTTGVDRLTLNHGTAIEPDDATPLVNTSSLAYLDRNGNEDLDDTESLEHYPVVTIEEYGDGRVIVVGDPSIFINTMLDRPDNRAFLTALLAAHDRTVLDVSKMGTQPPLVAALLTLRGWVPLQLVVGVAAVLGTSGLVTRWDEIRRIAERWRGARDLPETDPDPEVLAAQVHEAHPDWEEDRIERVMAGVIQTDAEERDDE